MSRFPNQSKYLFSQYEATLADAAEIDSGWLDMEQVDKYQAECIASATGMTLVIESSNVSGGGEADITSTTTINSTFHLFNVIARQRFIRVRWQNNTGGQLTDCALSIKASYGSSDKQSVFPLNVEPSDFSQAAVVQAVSKGQQPDGDYVNAPADGSAASSSATLAADATYTSAWVDTDGWNTIELFVASDVPSAEQGVILQFTDDAQAGAPTVRAERKYTFKEVDIERGYFDIRIPTILDGVRIKYTNGALAQSSFFIDATLRVNPENGRWNDANAQLTADYLTEVAFGTVSNYDIDTVFGRNPDIDTATAPEDVWNGSGNYTGFNATGNENLQTFSASANDTGTLVSSGNATGGSGTTLVDAGATFQTDGVAVGDVLLNDTNGTHGYITAVNSETQVTVLRMIDGEIGSLPNVSGNAYRIATTNGTGAAVVKWERILDEDFAEQEPVYVIMNGATTVSTTGNFYRLSKGKIILAGSGGTNAGNITARQAVTTANVFAVMPASYGATTIGAYTVPAGKNIVIRRVRSAITRANGSAGSATISLRARPYGGPFFSARVFELPTGGPVNFTQLGGDPFGPGTDLKFRVDQVSDNNTIAEAAFEFVSIDL